MDSISVEARRTSQSKVLALWNNYLNTQVVIFRPI